MKGIYGYYDTLKGEISYIGKDSYIDKNQRHKDHLKPSKYNEQVFNRVLQKNPNRYKYKVIYECQNHLDEKDLNGLEIQYINALNPKFNFTDGGDGMVGFKHSEDTLKKMRENPSKGMLGKKHSDKTLERMSKSAKLRHKTKPNSSTGIYRVTKHKDDGCIQGFMWCYQYIEDGKRKYIRSVDLQKLEEKVKSKNLEWIKYQ